MGLIILSVTFPFQIISYNSPRGGVSVLTEKGETTTSYLLIQQAKPTDSGKYPSYAHLLIRLTYITILTHSPHPCQSEILTSLASPLFPSHGIPLSNFHPPCRALLKHYWHVKPLNLILIPSL
jgi:hypothetical protein